MRGKLGANVDLNGDGDTLDDVWFVFDVAGRTVRNLGLAAPFSTALPGLPLTLPDGFVFYVSESRQGRTDLNGDGDHYDTQVAFVLPFADGEPRNLGLALWSMYESGENAAVFISEGAQDEDHNGDGDDHDLVAGYLRANTWQVESLGLAAGGVSDYLVVSAGPELFSFGVNEAKQSQDLDGDGLRSSVVAHVYDQRSGAISNLMIPVPRTGAGGSRSLKVLGDTVWAYIDSPPEDAGLAVWHPGHPVHPLRVWAYPPERVGDHFLMLLREVGVDHNGDGDTHDNVVWFANREGVIRESDLSASDLVGSRGGALLWLTEDGSVDLNGDGDANDRVVFAGVEGCGSLINLGVSTGSAAFSPLSAGTELALFAGSGPHGSGAYLLDFSRLRSGCTLSPAGTTR